MNLLPNDDTLGEFPIECGYDNPNCLGGFSTILGARDAAMYTRYGYPDVIPFEPYRSQTVIPSVNDQVLISTASTGPLPPTQTATPTGTQTQNDRAETMDSNFVLVACAVVLGGILLLGGSKN